MATPKPVRCPICASEDFSFAWKRREFRLFRCDGCGMIREIAGDGAAAAAANPERAISMAALRHLLIEASPLGQTLVIGGLSSSTSVTASALDGWSVDHAPGLAALDTAPFSARRWPTVVLLTSLLTLSGPDVALRRVQQCLESDGQLILALPLIDAGPMKLPGPNWPEWRIENRWYFSRETLHLLLLRSGFDRVWFRRKGSAEPSGSVESAAVSPPGLLPHMWDTLYRFAHQLGLFEPESVPSSTVYVTARAAAEPAEPVVSIVVPAFNESATFAKLMDALLAKELEGLRKEIIVVESGSGDGTRELALQYADRAGVKLLLQPAPRGKGNAVREGIAAATGHILMIQDADLEYDLDDYEAVLRPILQWRSMFVLGSRHRGNWKMRHFSDAPLTSIVFNFGHLFFTAVLNVLLRQEMSDPFTMFKVVRMDALHGLEFVCNRFDFDHELVIKLVRKGYSPLEIPVNYRSRSFAEGKKVSIVRDGLTWVWKDIKLRFGPIGKRPH